MVVCGAAASVCGSRSASIDDISVEWKMTPAQPAVDARTLTQVTLRDRMHRAVTGAKLQIEAHMAHPGMAPVIAPATEMGDGVYQAPIRLTMDGEWILLVTGSLADGRRLNQKVHVAQARRPG